MKALLATDDQSQDHVLLQQMTCRQGYCGFWDLVVEFIVHRRSRLEPAHVCHLLTLVFVRARSAYYRSETDQYDTLFFHSNIRLWAPSSLSSCNGDKRSTQNIWWRYYSKILSLLFAEWSHLGSLAALFPWRRVALAGARMVKTFILHLWHLKSGPALCW